jgi:hypothetical protein
MRRILLLAVALFAGCTRATSTPSSGSTAPLTESQKALVDLATSVTTAEADKDKACAGVTDAQTENLQKMSDELRDLRLLADFVRTPSSFTVDSFNTLRDSLERLRPVAPEAFLTDVSLKHIYLLPEEKLKAARTALAAIDLAVLDKLVETRKTLLIAGRAELERCSDALRVYSDSLARLRNQALEEQAKTTTAP